MTSFWNSSGRLVWEDYSNLFHHFALYLFCGALQCPKQAFTENAHTTLNKPFIMKVESSVDNVTFNFNVNISVLLGNLHVSHFYLAKTVKISSFVFLMEYSLSFPSGAIKFTLSFFFH